LNQSSLLIHLFLLIQPTGDFITTEGDTVTLDCTFETTSTSYSRTLFWYKQEVNDYPKYMLKSFSNTAENAPEFQKDRFDATINETSHRVDLQISSAALSDSAVYYCALQLYQNRFTWFNFQKTPYCCCTSPLSLTAADPRFSWSLF
uniref:Ig-like domain-containing protein n=1 Tax=Sander lucioperca TaxID=283035 RepID=A0A8C9XAJ2_SANLU